MSKYIFDQYVGENRPFEFDFRSMVGTIEDIQSFSISTDTIAGEGDMTVTGAVENDARDKVGCYLRASAPIVAEVACTATTPSQTLTIKARVRCL